MSRFDRLPRGGANLGTDLATRSSMMRNSAPVYSFWRGLADNVEFIAVGGGGSGGGGNWTNDNYGLGGGGGGLAAGNLATPVGGTITVAAAGSNSECLGNFGNAGGNGSATGFGSPGAGGTRSTTGGGNGGAGGGNNGPTSSITGSSTYYGGGGGNSAYGSSPPGGLGGGGTGGQVNGFGPTGGTANTGGGGGGNPFGNGAGGGSGIVIVKYRDDYPPILSIDAGLTYTVSVSGGFRTYTFTAGTGRVVF